MVVWSMDTIHGCKPSTRPRFIGAQSLIRNAVSLGCAIAVLVSFVVASKAPEASSTILKMHKLYTLQPPHDTRLYDILHVSPNATMVQITKSYRKLNRKYHPDKLSMDSSSNRDKAKQKLQEIQHAYDLLKDDRTRLPYHKYGLVDTSLAVLLLMGPQAKLYSRHRHAPDPDLIKELFQLMGYSAEDTTSTNNPIFHIDDTRSSDDQQVRQRQRRVRIAARLTERIRPLVEGSVDESIMAHVISEECDRLKTLPMGAQIIRCIGRGYRHAGQDYLARHKHKRDHYNNLHKQSEKASNKKKSTHFHDDKPPSNYHLVSPPETNLPKQVAMDMSLSMRQQWRQAKSYWTAALASGRVAWAEQRWTRQERQRQKRKQELKKQRQQKRITDGEEAEIMYGMPGHPELGEMYTETKHNPYDLENEILVDDDEDTIDFSEDDEDEIKELERLKVQQALLQSMQVEALWKVSKIDLDHTVQEACQMILESDHFLFPSPVNHFSDVLGDNGDVKHNNDGWIASRSGETIYADVARLRAAAAMVMYGDMMVHCSKQGTSWKD